MLEGSLSFPPVFVVGTFHVKKALWTEGEFWSCSVPNSVRVVSPISPHPASGMTRKALIIIRNKDF